MNKALTKDAAVDARSWPPSVAYLCTGKELAMRSTAARWCSAHPDLACQAISRLQVICCGKNIPRARLYLKILGARPTVRLIMEDGEEWTEGTFYSAIAYEKLCQKP